MEVESNAQVNLQIQLNPTMTVTGPAGSWQQIQYAEQLTPTNWVPLAHVLIKNGPVTYTDITARNGRRFYRSLTLTNLADTNLVWIARGSFLMGSPQTEIERRSNEGPQTTITLTRGFFMGKFEVTELEYASLTGTNPSTFSQPDHWSYAVTSVSYENASNYCRLLTSRDLSAFRIPPGWAYRLPTEAEWEYACRAGSTTPFHYGNVLYANPVLGNMANFDGQHPYPATELDPTGFVLNHPARVGSYAPNAFGLYDMHGNVQEFCLASFGLTSYPGGQVTDPRAAFPIVRGGGFVDFGARCRAADRTAASVAATQRGFRVVLAALEP